VAGKKSTPRPPVLDEAWLSVVAQLGDGPPLIFGGRSSGARVACRTAAAGGAVGVLALAFPLMTPAGANRQDELDAVAVPVLVVQGANDRFGVPENATVVKGDHGLKSDLPAVAEAARAWLKTLI
jgi:predicted alpha/beta-hydrolase family hydrolase